MFQINYSDGLARSGVLETSHGKLLTPTIFPVHNLGADSGWNTPIYWKKFPEINTGMFNASYFYMDKRGRLDRILESGIHKYINFPGVAFVDSGGFILRKYGLTVTQEEVLEIQEKSRADIASTLDYPIELTANPKNFDITMSVKNAKRALEIRRRKDMLLYASVHGYDPIILRNVIRHLVKSGEFDGFAVGSLMPSFSNYRLLVDLVFTARREVPSKPLHVYGLSGLLVTALLIYLGVDSVDSSVFVIAAGKRDYMVPGFRRVSVYKIEAQAKTPCKCPICESHSMSEIRMSRKFLSLHNLWVCWSQIKEIRTAIREGLLEDYLSKRFEKNPWARRAFNYAQKRSKFGLKGG